MENSSAHTYTHTQLQYMYNLRTLAFVVFTTISNIDIVINYRSWEADPANGIAIPIVDKIFNTREYTPTSNNVITVAIRYIPTRFLAEN